MGLRSMTPLIGILDDCDRPDAAMLVVVWGDPRAPRAEYINPQQRTMGPARLPTLSHFTAVQTFGVRLSFSTDGQLVTCKSKRSRARYPDGKHRRWQGEAIESVEIRPAVGGPVLKAVRDQHRQDTA